MSIFKYTLASGATYEVEGPADATQAQADKIFYEQVAAGSLVGYRPGDKLTSTETVLAKFGLSRQDRGIAGVEDAIILSVISGKPTSISVPDLIDVPIINPITQEDFATVISSPEEGTTLGPPAVGPLKSTEVQAVLAQIASTTDQPSDVISQEKGIGKYGFSCLQLEQTGYVKPGTYQSYLNQTTFANQPYNPSMPNPNNFTSVMNTPSIWTGKNNVYGVDDILGNDLRQNEIQVGLLENSYNALAAAGLITQPNTAAATYMVAEVFTSVDSESIQNLGNAISENASALMTNASKFGTQLTDLWEKGINLDDLTDKAMDSLAKASKFAVEFAQGQVSSLVSGVQDAPGFVNTINRSTVDAATTRMIGNGKIPSPTYTLPTSASAMAALDVKQAQQKLQELQQTSADQLNKVGGAREAVTGGNSGTPVAAESNNNIASATSLGWRR